MPFKLTKQTATVADTPEAMFRDFKNRQVEGLLAHQADLLRAYQDRSLKKSDVALQLPTGSGKTLVGLLVGEWRRRRYGEQVVYLCPTRQLVHQVAEQAARKYGIRVNAFTGKQKEFDPNARAEYLNSESVAITTYSALFNTNTFFSKPDVIIIDDAHAAENYIAEFWSLNINRKGQPGVFDAVVSALEPCLSRTHYQRLVEPTDEAWDLQWVDKVATPSLLEVSDTLTALLDEQVKQTDLTYSWSVIRDHLRSCHAYISTRSVLIRPVIPPTLTFKPFASATQRVYMSATLGAGGDLERITGVPEIQRLPIPEGWDKQGIGRRLFFFPERSLDAAEANKLTLGMVQRTPRGLLLVPDDRTATLWKKAITDQTDYDTVAASEIEKSKTAFVESDKAVAVMANRYDGIDFIGDECRLLIVYDLPRAMNLQERFIVTRLAATVLLNDRIQTRVVQAVGRCTRSATDYSAVIVLGDELNQFFLERERRSFLHPEIQAELEFGIEQSRNITAQDFLDNLDIFLAHDEDWEAADEQIIAVRKEKVQKELPGTAQLMISVRHEVRYQYALWAEDYEGAVRECDQLLTALTGPEVQGYRAFWNYLAGSAAWLGANQGIPGLEGVARKYFRNAAGGTQGIPWLRELSRLNMNEPESVPNDFLLGSVIEGLENRLERLGTANDRKFEAEAKSILDNLNGDASDRFEEAHKQLGALLGYRAENSFANAAPDPWWIAGDQMCFVAEDFSPTHSDVVIGATKVRQAGSHPKWIRENVHLRDNAEIISYIVSPCQKLDHNAATFAGDVCHLGMDDFRQWASMAVGIVRQLRTSFPGTGNLEWRQRAMQEYRDAGLDPNSIKSRLQQSPLIRMEKTASPTE